MCSKLKKPSKADAQVLKKLFPLSSATYKRSNAAIFDPSEECVATIQKKGAFDSRVAKLPYSVLTVQRRELKKEGYEKKKEFLFTGDTKCNH